MKLFELLNEIGLCESKTKARKLIEQGACRINGEKETDAFKEICAIDGNTYEVGPRHKGKIAKVGYHKNQVSVSFKYIIHYSDFETFVIYHRRNEKYTIRARMKTKRLNENYKEDNLPEYSSIIYQVPDFEYEFMNLDVEERRKIPITHEFPVKDIYNEYIETFKMLEEYDSGILPENHNKDMEFFNECLLNGNWEALATICFDSCPNTHSHTDSNQETPDKKTTETIT